MTGCPELVRDGAGYCPTHIAHVRARIDRERGSSTARGYNWQWRRAAKAFLDEHPLCECDDCEAGAKRVTPASVVDHIIAHKGDQKLFWDVANWRAMSKQCHDRKTAMEDGRWG